ncbi:zinc transporter ZIP13 homolog [Nilaparvata lugens]|uniref:zinc transporter ZIP13 homolog n=1 Tax=Nilaparvata lugens TaxID=108931 RepID=UPI00193DF415|nr:zinc transporter ZIP13 homolog [Nilaparvata lugens]
MDLQSNFSSLSIVACSSNSTASYQIGDFYRTVMDQLNSIDFLNNVIPTTDYNPMLWSLIGSVIVGLSGVFPLLVIPIEEGANLNKGASGRTLKVLLSFAVGGLLGDVFLHLLPEAWNQQFKSSESSMFCGLWVLAGLLVFIIAEKAFAFPHDEEEEEGEEQKEMKKEKSGEEKKLLLNNNTDDFSAEKKEKRNGFAAGMGSSFEVEDLYKQQTSSQQPAVVVEKKITSKQMSGYLNLVANSIDNFAHGLAVGGSFVLGARIGLLSTLAIVVHEVPHEVGDFAILLRAGFTRWQATKAQMLTASAGMLGAYVAVACSGVTHSIEARTSWILPFTAGGFLHIALVTTLPELLQEQDWRESIKQMLSLITGILIMAVLTALVE